MGCTGEREKRSAVKRPLPLVLSLEKWFLLFPRLILFKSISLRQQCEALLISTIREICDCLFM